MNRATIKFLATLLLCGCAATGERLVGEPVYFKHINNDVFWENIIVYGKLEKEVLRTPTSVYHSAFGHGYCMAEEVSFEAIEYIQGSGPALIEFIQNKVDSCQPIAENIGFGESILFLSKNQYRGIWSTGSVRIDRVNGEARIYRPADIINFLPLENFDSLLSEYDKPLDWGVDAGYLSEQELDKLQERGVLSYRLDPKDKHNSFYLIEMYKYIKVEALLDSNF